MYNKNDAGNKVKEFQIPRLVINHQVVAILVQALLVITIVFGLAPFVGNLSLLASFFFGCCAIATAGGIF